MTFSLSLIDHTLVHHNILSLVSNQTITFNTSQINTFEIDDSMSTHSLSTNISLVILPTLQMIVQ
jgi:hypothetical protein